MKTKKSTSNAVIRNVSILTGALLLLSAMLLSSEPQVSSASSGDLSSAISVYSSINGTVLDDCALCHTSAPALNSYGTDYLNNGRNSGAFTTIEGLDSDGDGFTNLAEINGLTFPGDAADFPVASTSTYTPSPTNTPAPTNTNTPVPTNTNTPVASNTPTATSVPGSTNTPTPTGTNTPVASNTPTPTAVFTATATNLPNSAYVTISFTSSSVVIGNYTIVSVNLNNVPAEGISSAEFTCTFDPAVIEVYNINAVGLFGPDPLMAVNGPQSGTFIAAISGNNGNEAVSSGAAITFFAKGLVVGQSVITCQARVLMGNLNLASLPTIPATLFVTTTQGSIAGQVIANKPVTVTLYNASNAVVGSASANPDGTFTLLAEPGSYTVVASASGYLKAQGSAIVASGSTTTLPTISLIAGDIDGNNVIDQFDVLTIGMNYNGTTPTAADLNNDGIINLLDLEILSVHYRESGSQAWN